MADVTTEDLLALDLKLSTEIAEARSNAITVSSDDVEAAYFDKSYVTQLDVDQQALTIGTVDDRVLVHRNYSDLTYATKDDLNNTTLSLENLIDTSVTSTLGTIGDDFITIDAWTAEKKSIELSVFSQVEAAKSEASTIYATQTDLDSTTASITTTVNSVFDTNMANIENTYMTYADMTTARGEITNEITAEVGAAEARVATQYVSEATLTSAVASAKTELNATIGANTAAITNEQTARTTALDAIATDLLTLEANVGDNSALVTELLEVEVTEGVASATRLETLEASLGGLEVSLTSEDGVFVGAHIWGYGDTIPPIDEPLKIGYIKFAPTAQEAASVTYLSDDSGIQWQYFGGTIGPAGNGWVSVNFDISTDLEDYKNQNDLVVNSLQSQVSGSISTWFKDYAPDDTNVPWSTWKAADTTNGNTVEQDAHLGDLFYDRGTGYSYRFSFIDIPDDTPDLGTTYTWVRIADTDIIAALDNASRAQDTADGKRTIYYTDGALPTASVVNSTVIPIEIGDLWIPPSNYLTYVADTIYRWNGSSWVDATKYTDDQYAKDIESGAKQIDISSYNLANSGWGILSTDSDVSASISSALVDPLADIQDLQATQDGEVVVYYQSSAPTITMNYGDYWLDTNSSTAPTYAYSVYRYESITGKNSQITDEIYPNANSWRLLSDNNMAKTIIQGYKAQVIAEDGKADATAALSELSDMSEDDVITPVEKQGIQLKIKEIDDEYSNILSLATTFGFTALGTDYSTAYSSLTAYLSGASGLLNNMSTSSNIDRNVFDTRFSDYYTAKVAILESTPSEAKAIADGKIKTFYQATVPTSGVGIGDIWIDTSNNNATYIAASDGSNEITSGEWEKITDESSLDNFLTATYAVDLLGIRDQIDGVAVTYFQDNMPYAANIGTAANNGDVWYDTSETVATAYKYTYEYSKIENGSEVVVPSAWVSITNTFILSSLAAASTTKAAADRSIQNFTDDPVHPFFTGDTWMEGSLGDIYVCILDSTALYTHATDKDTYWTIASKYTDNSVLETYLISDGNGVLVGLNLNTAYVDENTTFNTYLEAEIVDKSVSIFHGADHTLQTNARINDIYIETTTDDTSGGITIDVTETWKALTDNPGVDDWVQIDNNNSLLNLRDLSDGKRTIYGGDTEPTATLYDNDLWIPSSDLIATDLDGDPYKQGEIYSYSESLVGWKKATRYTEDLGNFTTTTNQTFATLQNQVDNKIEYIFKDNDVNHPLTTISAGWDDAHNGNVVYYTEDDTAWWYSSATNTFLPIDNTDIYKALGVANSKITTFYDVWASIPPSTSQGDIWVVSDKDNIMYVAADANVTTVGPGNWELMRDTSNDITIANSALKINDLEAVRDGEIEIFYRDDLDFPTGADYGDYWVVTDDFNGSTYKVYRYEDQYAGSTDLASYAWRVNTGDMARTLSSAHRASVLSNLAQISADRSVKIFYALDANEPPAEGVGDLWIVQDWWEDYSTTYTQPIVDNPFIIYIDGVGDTFIYDLSVNTQIDTDNLIKLTRRWDGAGWIDLNSLSDRDVASSWASGASKLIKSPNGGITGWSFADGTAINSTFKINADTFIISSATENANWTDSFTIEAGSPNKIKFDGIVDFTNTINDDSYKNDNVLLPSHTSGLIADRPTAPEVGSTYTATDNSVSIFYMYTSNNGWQTEQQVFDNGVTSISGDRISSGSISGGSISGGTISGDKIQGGTGISAPYINGGVITGAIIKASYLDTSSSLYLTNWAVVTVSTIDTGTYSPYHDNFSTDDIGDPIADVNGYYRLWTVSPIVIGEYTYSIPPLIVNNELLQFSGPYERPFADYLTASGYIALFSGAAAEPIEGFSLPINRYDNYTVGGSKLINEGIISIPNFAKTAFASGELFMDVSEYFGTAQRTLLYFLDYVISIDCLLTKTHYNGSGDSTVNIYIIKNNTAVATHSVPTNSILNYTFDLSAHVPFDIAISRSFESFGEDTFITTRSINWTLNSHTVNSRTFDINLTHPTASLIRGTVQRAYGCTNSNVIDPELRSLHYLSNTFSVSTPYLEVT